MGMMKTPPRPPKTMATPVQNAIRQSGGTVSKTKVAPLPEAPVLKKANQDVLAMAVESLGYQPEEKSAAFGFRAATPKLLQRSGHDPLWRYVPGVAGAVMAYNGARNDGQSTLASMGMGALGGATGALVGNAAGKYHWNQTAAARGQAAFQAQKQQYATQKYYDRLGSDKNLQARATLNAVKDKWHEPGILNKAQAGWAHVKEFVGREANPGISDADLLKRHFGGLQSQADELGKNMRQTGAEMRNENKHYYSNIKYLKNKGVDMSKVTEYLAQRGLDARVILNDPRGLENRHFRDSVKGQGAYGDVYQHGLGGWAPWYSIKK